jgi:hypothetical protein
MSTSTFKALPALAASLVYGALAITSLDCGFGNSSHGSPGAAGSTTGGGNPGSAGAGNPGTAGEGNPGTAGQGNPGTAGQGNPGTAGQGNPGTAGQGNPGTAGQGNPGTAGQGNPGTAGGQGMAGNMGMAGAMGAAGTSGWKNYEVTASFPKAPVAIPQKAGQLKYTKVVIQDQFLAESCSIADYNGDGIPDVSAGRTWYEGTNDPATTFKTLHNFRDGHGPLPRAGAGPELNTGVSDDWADYPWDVDGDGDTDIINIAQCDVPEANSPTLANGPGTPNKIGTVQVHATAVWYENPGRAGNVETITTNWASHLMHADVRMEQHEMVDFNGDGYPEILGACRDCGMGDTKGYYQGDPTKPTALWTYHQVTGHFTFPFGNLGWMHGIGGGDINGDGLPDWMDRSGAYLQQPGGLWNLTPCTGKDTPKGCGWIQQKSPLLPMGFSALGINDGVGNIGPSHMFAVDMDMDGCSDVVAAEWAHGSQGLWWYQQKKDTTGCTSSFNRLQFMGDSQKDKPADVAKWGAGFTEPHAFNVYDMDGDGRPDVIGGKMRFAHPYNQNDPDPDGAPYLYVFKNMATPDPNNGGPITLKPILVDGDPTAAPGTTAAGMGVGRQFSIGHVNTDGIMDICVSSKLGLAVFLGQ